MGEEKTSESDSWIIGALLLGFILGHFFTIYSVTLPVGQ